MNRKKKIGKIALFWLIEGVLLALAGVFAFTMIGYTVIALLCVGLALLFGAYKLITLYSKKNQKRARMLRIALTSLVILAFVALAIVEIPIIYAARSDENPEADYLIVLGAGINGTVPSLTLCNRLTAAKDYLDKYPDAKAVVSGGQGSGEDITEAECMRRWLEDRGISRERILIEDKSTSTYENLKYSFAVISADGGDGQSSIAIVSNEYHLYRAKLMAEELGVEAFGVAAKTTLPLLMVNYFIREGIAVAALIIM